MRVLLVCSEKEPRIVNVPHELPELQRLIGGMIEVVEPFYDDIALVCDEKGRSNDTSVSHRRPHEYLWELFPLRGAEKLALKTYRKITSLQALLQS